jgi:mRNA interferase HigB
MSSTNCCIDRALRAFVTLADGNHQGTAGWYRQTNLDRQGYRFGNLKEVRIISKAAITEFCKTHKEALEALMYWYAIAKRANWQTLSDTREDFRHADLVAPFTVLNIGGNKYRLVTVIKYRWQVIYIRHILTHAEYTKERWKP